MVAGLRCVLALLVAALSACANVPITAGDDGGARLNTPDKRCDIAIVVFHFDGGHPEGEKARRFVDMVFGSARRVHKNVCCYILSDETTDVSDVQDAEKFVGFKVEERHKTLAQASPLFNKLPGGFLRQLGLAIVAGTPAKMEAQVEFLKSHTEFRGNTHVVFVDTDVLFARSVLPLFGGKPFSVALTPQDRETDNHAINAGFVAVHKDDIPGGVTFFEAAIDSWNAISAENGNEPFYFGDQKALKRVVDTYTCNTLKWIGAAPGDLVATFTEPHHVRIRMATNIQYNCKALFGGGCDKSTAVYHFSVRRKLKMPKVWQLFSRKKENEALKMAGMRLKPSAKAGKPRKPYTKTYSKDCRPKAA